ncbi:MAG TPA: type I-B CRISPR-associated protein Cas7/Cst2/DevR [Fimbriimonadales bacterium]|nr:type I-B CRISPR-associated protein Cas7/Cst2/DevR [Fimbriimonadales bacterium]
MKTNLFATVLTYAAPSSNYRGESEENRAVMQKITKDGHEYPVISPESMRNALREILAAHEQPMNRRRLHNEDQLAVEFKERPDESKYADDFLFGYLVADKNPKKRDSVLRMNMAVGLHPYRFDAMLNQSPLNAGKSPWQNAKTSALLHREVAHTDFQYPFALAGSDCTSSEKAVQWTRALLGAIGELNGVAGGHARSYFEMAPKSIVIRLTPSLVAGFNTYGFSTDGILPELSRVNEDDLPGAEFIVGGEIVRAMQSEEKDRLQAQGVLLVPNPQRALKSASDRFLGATA